MIVTCTKATFSDLHTHKRNNFRQVIKDSDILYLSGNIIYNEENYKKQQKFK